MKLGVLGFVDTHEGRLPLQSLLVSVAWRCGYGFQSPTSSSSIAEILLSLSFARARVGERRREIAAGGGPEGEGSMGSVAQRWLVGPSGIQAAVSEGLAVFGFSSVSLFYCPGRG